MCMIEDMNIIALPLSKPDVQAGWLWSCCDKLNFIAKSPLKSMNMLLRITPSKGDELTNSDAADDIPKPKPGHIKLNG